MEISTVSLNGPAKLIARRSISADRTIEPGDVVWVPFPFVEAPRIRDRPAVVVSLLCPARGIELAWVLMVTSAANRGWEGDVSLEADYGACGLEVPCVVRTAKLATVEISRTRKGGSLIAERWAEVLDQLRKRLP